LIGVSWMQMRSTTSAIRFMSTMAKIQVFFETFCGFNLNEFDYLYSIVEMRLSVRRRGRQRVIGARDSLMLFLHWLRSGRGCMEIAHQFELCEATLYRKFHEIIDLVHDRFVDEFIGSHARDRFIAGRTSPTVAWWWTQLSSIAGVQLVRMGKHSDAFPGNVSCIALSRRWSRLEMVLLCRLRPGFQRRDMISMSSKTIFRDWRNSSWRILASQLRCW
jgi:hypothetical protein